MLPAVRERLDYLGAEYDACRIILLKVSSCFQLEETDSNFAIELIELLNNVILILFNCNN